MPTFQSGEKLEICLSGVTYIVTQKAGQCMAILFGASPKWWENLFLKHGFVREKNIEKCIYNNLKEFFVKVAPTRRSFFVLRRLDWIPDSEVICSHLRSTIEPVVNGKV